MDIEKLKATHNCDIYELKVKNKAGEHITVYLKELDRNTYKSNSALIQKDEMLGVEGLLRSLYVGGDDVMKIINDFKALRSAAVTLVPLLEVEAGELKKN
jgi:hypothetical protein